MQPFSLNKKSILTLGMLVLFGVGCSTESKSVLPSQSSPISSSSTVSSTVPMHSQIVMKGRDIYFSGIKRGEVSDQKIRLDLGDDLQIIFPEKFGIFEYSGHGLPEEPNADMIHAVSIGIDDHSNSKFAISDALNVLTVSDFVAWPYQLYDPVTRVSYQCNGSLVKGGGKDVPNYYCETNGKDFLSQYEFSSAGTNSFATGDAPWTGWYKLYIKKAGNKSVFIFMDLGPGLYPVY